LDGTPFVVGIISLVRAAHGAISGSLFPCSHATRCGTVLLGLAPPQLKQFHVAHTESFLAYMGQYIRAMVNAVAVKYVQFLAPGAQVYATR